MTHSSLIGSSLPPVRARKPPISSGFGRVQQLGLIDLPLTIPLIQKVPKHFFISISPNPGNIHRPVVQTLVTLLELSYTLAVSSVPGELVPLTQPRSTGVCLPWAIRMPICASTPFDSHAGLPLQAMHHLSVRAARCIPAKAGATTSLPIREASTHSNPSTPPLPALHDHYSSLLPTLIASHPRSLRIVAEDSSPRQ